MATKRVKYAAETHVPVTQTRMEIESMLTKFGATSFAFMSQPKAATIMFECQGRRIRFNLPLKSDTTDAKTAKLHRSKWRALLLTIKSKLVSIDTEIETFEEAFLSQVVLADGRTVAESVKPVIEQQYKTGQVSQLLLEGPRNNG